MSEPRVWKSTKVDGVTYVEIGVLDEQLRRHRKRFKGKWWNTSDRAIGIVWPEEKSVLFHVRPGEGFDPSPDLELNQRHLPCPDGRYDKEQTD